MLIKTFKIKLIIYYTRRHIRVCSTSQSIVPYCVKEFSKLIYQMERH